MTPGTYYIETYGCQMNVHDSEIMSSLMESIDFSLTTDEKTADVVIINTCAIRGKSQHKVYSALGRFRQTRKNNPNLVIVVAGCVAQQEREALLKKSELVDLVLGTHQIAELPVMVEKIRRERVRITKTDFSRDVQSLGIKGVHPKKNQVCSFLTIMQGCSNFCSYCVVPFTRGPEQSRPLDEILEEAHWLVSNGIKEITLLGQNVNAYGLDLGSRGAGFCTLLESLNNIIGLQRIRFTTSHPKDFDENVIDAMASMDKVCEHIHLPIQSGSDSILESMRRRYTKSEYFSKIEALRGKLPGAAITTDIIVGFPGETEQDFRDTISTLDQIKYDQIFSFKYSVRPRTAAETFPDHVSEDIKKDRLAQVHELQDKITSEYHKSMEASTVEVLVEKDPSGPSGQASGRTRTNKIVNFESPITDLVGLTVKVRILEGLKHSLRGKLLQESLNKKSI